MRRRLHQDVDVPALPGEGAGLVLHELVAGSEDVPGVAERLEARPAALLVDQAHRVGQRLDDLRVVQVRGAVGVHQVRAVGLGPQRQELGELRVEPDPGDLATAGLVQLPGDGVQLVPVRGAHVGQGQAGLRERLAVHQDVAGVVELRHTVERPADRHLPERGRAVVGGLDPDGGDPVVQWLDDPLRRVAAHQAAVDVDQVGGVTAGDRGEELLRVEVALVEPESHLRISALERVDPGLAHVVRLPKPWVDNDPEVPEPLLPPPVPDPTPPHAVAPTARALAEPARKSRRLIMFAPHDRRVPETTSRSTS